MNKHTRSPRPKVTARTYQRGRHDPARRPNAGNTASGGMPSAMTRTQPSGQESQSMPMGLSLESARKSIGSVGTAAMDLADGALKSIKTNPMPYALAGAGVVCIGAGITWLLMSAGKSAVDADAGQGGALGDGIQSSMKQAGKSMKRVGRSAGEKVSELTSSALESGKKLEKSVEDVVREHPIAVGAALLVTGAAIALAMPRSTLEDTWLGRERYQLVSSAQQLAKGAVKKREFASR